MINVVTVIGTRPEFIRASILSRALSAVGDHRLRETVVNTGQHYDYEMSEVFFDELASRRPDVSLGVRARGRAEQLATILKRLTPLLQEITPDAVIVHGDTNSTIAGALSARCLHIPVVHVEAGLRSGDREMVEEQNRTLTDHLSQLHYCPTVRAYQNLQKENLSATARIVGDLSYDSHREYVSVLQRNILEGCTKFPAVPDRFCLVTIHRAENTDDGSRLREIVKALNALTDPVPVFPVHPRTRQALRREGLELFDHVVTIEPVGFLNMLWLESRCELVITDSGGVQKEAYFFRRPCITVRDATEWTETVEEGANRLVSAEAQQILAAIDTREFPEDCPRDLFGDGNSASRLTEELLKEFER